MTANRENLSRWSARLRAAAGLAWAVWPDRTMDPGTLVQTFRDEAGHRREVDEPFLRAVLKLPPGAPGGQASAPDVALWRAAAGVPSDWPAAVATLALQAAPGPLTPAGSRPIEIWTEVELCLLHALWRIARLGRDDGLRDRCLAAAEWHLEHTQVDNATNHPWAIHVFVVLGAEEGQGDAMFHVEQMVHSAMLSLGRPDRLSAHILWDAADELDAARG